MQLPPALQAQWEPWLLFLADDPLLRALQGALLLLAFLAAFLVFYTTRDILLRTRSFALMLVSIALVAFLPIVGFLLYLLFRPSRTLAEREADALLREIAAHTGLPKNATKKAAKDAGDAVS